MTQSETASSPIQSIARCCWPPSVQRNSAFKGRSCIYGKLPFEKLEFVEQHEQKKIHVYIVRLGSLFGEADEQ